MGYIDTLINILTTQHTTISYIEIKINTENQFLDLEVIKLN